MPSADSVLNIVELEQARQAAAPRPPSSALAGRRAHARRGYNRWHTDTRVEAEEEGWLLTYLDVITLMLVMMVVMLAFSGPPSEKPGKQNEPASPTAQDRGAADSSAVAGAATGADGASSGNSIVPPVPLPVPRAQHPGEAPTAMTAPALANPLPHTAQRQPAPAGAANPPQADPLAGLPLPQLDSAVEVIRAADALRFRLSSELLFAAGASDLNPAAKPMLDQLAGVFQARPDLRLVVEGHTDSTPIQTERFPSNWELSTARAAAVARYLVQRGVAPQRLQASGFADSRPLTAPWNPVDRLANRRVELTMELPKTSTSAGPAAGPPLNPPAGLPSGSTAERRL